MTSFSPLKKCAWKLFTLRPELWQFPVIVIIPAPPEISSIGGGGCHWGTGDLKLGDERGWQEGRKGETISRVRRNRPPASNGGETGLSHLAKGRIWCESLLQHHMFSRIAVARPCFSHLSSVIDVEGVAENYTWVYLCSVQLPSCLWCEFDIARNKWGSGVKFGAVSATGPGWVWLILCYFDSCVLFWASSQILSIVVLYDAADLKEETLSTWFKVDFLAATIFKRDGLFYF